MQKQFRGVRIGSSTNGEGEIGHHIKKKNEPHTLYKINPKCTIDVNVKYNTIKVLGKNIVVSLRDLRLGRVFRLGTQNTVYKRKKINSWTS